MSYKWYKTKKYITEQDKDETFYNFLYRVLENIHDESDIKDENYYSQRFTMFFDGSKNNVVTFKDNKGLDIELSIDNFNITLSDKDGHIYKVSKDGFQMIV